MFDFSAIWSGFARQTVLCIGDCMLDEFVYGDVSRVSPEAPTLVMAVRRTDIMAGGAANVARNVAALGATCLFIGLIGRDEAAATLTAVLQKEARIEPILVAEEGRATTRKARFVSEHFSSHLLRADWETARPAAAAAEDELIGRIRFAMPRARAVILSDYAKGVLTPRVIAAAIAEAAAAGVPVIVDPKGRDFAIYRGARLITPNRGELAAATGHSVASDTDVVAAARLLLANTACEAVLVTRSDEGMSLVPAEGPAVHIPATPVKVRDVSGAGDTVVAALATLLAMGAPLEAAARAANAAASVVVGKRGTATVTAEELRARILPHAALVAEEKIAADDTALMQRVDAWRRQGLRVGFTNGCFDLLHPGHVKILTQARAACDRLIVGLNSDASVRRLKGETRPIQDEQARAEVLAALEAVDLVAVFAEDTPLRLIELVRPDVLAKGGDWSRETIVGHEIVEAAGGEIVVVGLAEGFSTTGIAQRIKASGGRL